MIIEEKKKYFSYLLLLFLASALLTTTSCKDPYVEPPQTDIQAAMSLRNAFPTFRPAVAIGAKSGFINVGPFDCLPMDSVVCVALLPKLEIPEVIVVDFIDIPIGPDPCPYSISCPPFIPIITELADQDGNPLSVKAWDTDPMMAMEGFLFIQFNQPEDEKLLTGSSYSLAQPITLESSWAKHMEIEGNVIAVGEYYTQYSKKYNTAIMAVPLKNIGHNQR